jgi:hypothetical protein
MASCVGGLWGLPTLALISLKPVADVDIECGGDLI